MSTGAFRFDALLNVYRLQEDALRGEIASLERERKGAATRIGELVQECEEAAGALTHGGRLEELEAVVRYVEGLRRWIEESRRREIDLQEEITERMAALRAIRTERMRFTKLKERHHKLILLESKRQEQKVTDEFAQRKRNR